MGYCGDAPSEKVIIFDWDDTICPSSFFDRQTMENIGKLPESDHKLFAEISKCAEKCLREASKYGEVIIITNSDDGWVKYSCERIIPSLLPGLQKYKIVSARTNYERFYPGQPLCWKAAAFAHEANEIFQTFSQQADETLEDDDASRRPSLELSDVSSEDSFDSSNSASENVTERKHVALREIISFGDSMEERTAVRIVSDQLDSTPKSVMFVPTPSPSQILGQLDMLTKHMKFVCEHKTSLDLEICSEEAQRCAESYLNKHSLERHNSSSSSGNNASSTSGARRFTVCKTLS